MAVMIILGATTFEGEPYSVSAARRFVRGALGAAGGVADDIELITSELVTNAILHGGAGRVGLRIATDGALIRLEVTDSGSGWLPRPRISAAGENGRGLLHVGALSERWGVHESGSGTTVWAEFHRSPAG